MRCQSPWIDYVAIQKIDVHVLSICLPRRKADVIVENTRWKKTGYNFVRIYQHIYAWVNKTFLKYIHERTHPEKTFCVVSLGKNKYVHILTILPLFEAGFHGLWTSTWMNELKNQQKTGWNCANRDLIKFKYAE